VGSWIPRYPAISSVQQLPAFPSGHSDSKEGRNLDGLIVEETIEFEAIDTLDPFDDGGNVAWTFEGEPTTLREERWLELYMKQVRVKPSDN
jgi:hypothetical protein